MSRAYDAKHAALGTHGNDRENAVFVFLYLLGLSQSDFEYEFNRTAEEYIYGEKS